METKPGDGIVGVSDPGCKAGAQLAPIHLSDEPQGFGSSTQHTAPNFFAYRWPTTRPLCRFYRFLGVAFL